MLGQHHQQQQQHPLATYTMRKSRQSLAVQSNQQQSQQQQQHIYAQTISRASNLHALQYLRNLNQQQQQIYGVSLPGDQQQQFVPNPSLFYYEPGVSLSSQERSLLLQQQQQQHQKYQKHQDSLMANIEQQALLNRPLCRCRVMYLGSSVPHITKNGLHGIQEPLKHLYPEEQFGSLPAKQQVHTANSTTIDISHLSSSLGIDSWLSVWSNGLLLENVDEFGRDVKRFFSIESLHYCAAVRFFDTTTLMPSGGSQAQVNEQTLEQQSDLNNNNNNSSILNQKEQQLSSNSEPADELARRQRQRKSAVRFLPLDAPLFQCPGMLDAKHPPVFASILRRTTGIKVLECHAFICRRDAAANALVRCCTHSYADFLSAKRLSLELGFRPTRPTTCGASDRRRSRSQGRSLAGQVAAQQQQLRRQTSSPVYAETTEASPGAGVASINLQRHPAATDSTGLSLEELDNSLGDNATGEELDNLSSEDNYAIISRHHPPQQQQSSSRKRRISSIAANNNLSSSASDEERRRAKGSSRSLYPDFMPQMNSAASSGGPQARVSATTSHRRSSSQVLAMEKLSHSMDLLGLGANSSYQDELTGCDGTADGAEYAVVRNKRHSRSMQNLDGPFEFSASAARSSRRTRNRRHSRHEQLNNQHHRRSASYQEMRFSDYLEPHQQQQQQHLRVPEVLPNQSIAPETSLPQPARQSRDERLVSRRIVHNSGSGSSSGGGKKRDIASGGSAASRSRRHERHRLYESQKSQQQTVAALPPLPPPQTLNAAACCAAAPAPPAPHLLFHPHHTHPHHLTSGHHPHQPQPLYLPCYLPYASPANIHQQPIYGSGGGGSIYESIAARNAAAAAAAYLAPAALVPQQLPPHQSYATLSRKSAGKGNSSSKKRSTSLARFRCLSPPVNFLGGKAPLPQSAERRQQQQQVNETSAKGDEQQLPPQVVEPSQVVSGQPGFISSAASVREKSKMSWIKRLSLTMSSSSANNYDPDQPLNLSSAPDGRTIATTHLASQQPKRRSSLFSGSLTLGRKAKQQPLASVIASHS